MPSQIRKKRKLKRPVNQDERTSRDALTVGEVFESTIADVLEMRDSINFNGVVDVGVTFKSVAIDKKGFISVIVGGNDSQETTTQIQLSTRIHLDE